MFIQIIIQEKSSNDYRSFLKCTDSNGIFWEIRGYGSNPIQATSSAWYKYSQGEQNFELFANPLPILE